MEKWSLTALADGLLSHALSAPSRRDMRTIDGGRPHLLHQSVIALGRANGSRSTTTRVRRPCRCYAGRCGSLPAATPPTFRPVSYLSCPASDTR